MRSKEHLGKEVDVATQSEPPGAMPRSARRPVRYANPWSRWLLARTFRLQHGIAMTPAPLLERVLRVIERRLLRIDLSAIRVEKPIFLIGLPRSGTTMLQDLLCAHPRVAYFTNAMHLFRSCFCAAEVMRKFLRMDFRGERFLEDSVEVTAGSPNEGLGFWGAWFGLSPNSLAYQPLRLADLPPGTVEEIRLALRKVIWCFPHPQARFFNKNPALTPYLPLLHELFPDAKFVHVVRDARPCANSLLKLNQKVNEQLQRIRAAGRQVPLAGTEFIPYPRLPGMAEYVATYSADDIRTTAHLWNAELEFVWECRPRLGSFYEVRYEDVLAEPQEEMSKLFDFCELPPPEPNNTAYWEKLRNVGTVHHQNRYGDYDLVEDICRENLSRLGYL